MAVDAKLIEKLLLENLPNATVKITDLAGDGEHYAAEVICELFRGKSRVQQHKLVYEALENIVGGQLHALALQTRVPD